MVGTRQKAVGRKSQDSVLGAGSKYQVAGASS